MAVDRTRYNFNGKTNLTKKALIYEVVKYFLEKNNTSLEELKKVFSEKSDFNISMFVTEEEYQHFNEDRRRRYFDEPFEVNKKKIYLSNQWGGDIFRNLLTKIQNQLQYTIQETLKPEEKEFRSKYKQFVATLPLQNSGNYAEFYTQTQQKLFKVNKNTSGSIVVRAFTEQASPMVISANQLSKVLFENGQYLYSSYEPVLIERILNENIVNQNEIRYEGEIESNNSHESIKNIILYGVPGVGKTHNIAKFIRLIEEGKSDNEIFLEIQNNTISDKQFTDELKERTAFVTFHQSFGYEDFIEGFRPNKEGQITIQQGIFKQICRNASDNPDEHYYLIIDEINRGNISKIFGELITLIEEDKRDRLEVTLPYSKEPFSVPSNLYIIGTMNSTDKSIALIDIALRRRFTFLKMEPKSDLIKYSKAKAIFEKLNEFLKERLDEDHQIGHSYFMKIKNEDDLNFVLGYKIKPLIEEYFYGDRDGYAEAEKYLDIRYNTNSMNETDEQ